jgi:predicted DsbA family dithiol-disulfide isomerase
VSLEVFSDYVWTFCWLAEPAVRQLQSEDDQVRVIWRCYNGTISEITSQAGSRE